MKKIILSVFTLSILLPTLAFASFDTSLKYGSRGDAVIELQDFLQDQEVYSGKVDGRFGLGTRKAVVAFQLANGLKGDGYFGVASRTKASSILALELKPSIDAEQTETGTTTTTTNLTVLMAGCTSTSAYSATTGQPCNSTTQPSILNFPAGCTSTFGFSITTGQACNNISTTVQQLQQTVQQIQQNTQQIAQNTIPPIIVVTPPPTSTDLCPNITGMQMIVPSGMIINSSGNCATPPPSPVSQKHITLSVEGELPFIVGYAEGTIHATIYGDTGQEVRNVAVTLTTSDGLQNKTLNGTSDSANGSCLNYCFDYTAQLAGTNTITITVPSLNLTETKSIRAINYIDSIPTVGLDAGSPLSHSASLSTITTVGSIRILTHERAVVLKEIQYDVISSDFIKSDLTLQLSGDFGYSNNFNYLGWNINANLNKTINIKLLSSNSKTGIFKIRITGIVYSFPCGNNEICPIQELNIETNEVTIL